VIYRKKREVIFNMRITRAKGGREKSGLPFGKNVWPGFCRGRE